MLTLLNEVHSNVIPYYCIPAARALTKLISYARTEMTAEFILRLSQCVACISASASILYRQDSLTEMEFTAIRNQSQSGVARSDASKGKNECSLLRKYVKVKVFVFFSPWACCLG